MEDKKLKKAKKILDLEDDADLTLLESIEELKEDVCESSCKMTNEIKEAIYDAANNIIIPEQKETDLSDVLNKLNSLSEEVKKKSIFSLSPKLKAELKGDKGDTTIVEKVIEKTTEIVKEIPIVTENVVERTTEEISGDKIVDRINTQDKQIKKEKVEGLESLERLVKQQTTATKEHIWQGVSEVRVKELISQNVVPAIPDTDTLQAVTDRGATTTNKITVPRVQFDTTATPATNAEGLLQWNATDGTLDLGMDGGDITMQVGQEMFQKVRNVSGSTILNGKPVYVNGRTGNRPNIYLAKGDAEATSEVVGLTTQDITSPADGFVTTAGYVRGIKTDYTGDGAWGTTWTAGDRLYVSKAVAGQLTNVEPNAPHHSDVVATVEIVHSNLGSLLVNINRHKTLEELSDVNGTPLETTGQIPVWNETAGYFDFDKNITDYTLLTDTTTFLKLDQTTPQTVVNGSPVFNAGLSSNGKVNIAGNTVDSTLNVGALEIQSYSVNNNWFGDNLYFNGSAFIRRSAGYGGLFYFSGQEGQFRYFASSTAGSSAGGSGNYVQQKQHNDGRWGIGGAAGSAITTTPGSFTGAQVYKDANGNLCIGTLTAGGKLTSYSNTTGTSTIHGYFTNVSESGRTQLIVSSGTYPNNFFSLMTHGTSAGNAYYATTLASNSDSGKAILLGQGTSMSEFVVGTYNDKPFGLFSNNTTRLALDSTYGVKFLDNARILSDSLKMYFGAGNDMSIEYNGTIGKIDTSLVGASDLQVACGTDKTLVLNETVWVDIDSPILIRTTGAGIPTLATFNGNLTMPQWAVNDFNQCESQEFIHEWKEGSTCYWHLHLNTNGLDATDRYVKFELEYAYSVAGVWTFPAVVTTADILIPANTPDKSQIIMPLANFTPTNTKIGDHFIARLKRVASTGTAPTNNPWIPMLQLHVQKDTIGSRQMTVK
jgi:hypothetical protein